MQLVAAILVVAYDRSQTVRDAMSWMSEAKRTGGVVFVVAAAAIAGGFLPQLAKIATRSVRRLDRSFWLDTLYVGFVFAVMGIEVDSLYRLQGAWFGTGNDPATLAKKTAADMFLAAPTIFVPTCTILLHARNVGFAPSRIRDAFSWAFYRRWVVPTLPLNWAFWIPMLFCVYALPANLQFPFAQIAEACWSLILLFIAKEVAE